LELEFRLIIYFLTSGKIGLRSLSRLAAPLHKISAASLDRSPLRDLLLQVYSQCSGQFFSRPLTALLPITQFLARCAPFSAPLTCPGDLSICLSVTVVSPAKTAELIEMEFRVTSGLWWGQGIMY